MEGPEQTNLCAICLGGIAVGGGQASFTAECSHTFHFSCISASPAHGNLVCPLCNAHWRPTPVAQPVPAHILRPRAHPVDPVVVFDDDEQLELASRTPDSQAVAGASSNTAAVVKTHTECSAIARDSASDNFAVLLHVKAPGMVETDAAPRAPLDLVTVLDVSRSMSGQKLALLKQAMRFVIDNLGPDDRLCVVSFSSEARRVTRLVRMSDAGKALTVSAVEFLAVRGGTNIAAGLRTAAKVLDERRHRNAVSSVMLLSDGQDTYTMVRRRGGEANYEALLPPSFLRTGGEWSAPIHTFGFGNDHDAAAMHVIAEATGGTFSFIENEEVIQDAFAQCVGGLLSVVIQEARMAIACVHPGVRVVSVKSSRYESHVDEDGRAASVRVGELYADEERRFLLFLAVPKAEESDHNTALVKLVLSYRDAATGLDVSVTIEDTVVARPEHAADAERSAEVARERVRVEAAEDIAAARAAAERGAYQEAVEILENRQRAVAQSGDGDAVIVALGAELRDMRGRVSSRQSYAQSGRAYMLAGMSAHQQQRANSRQMQMQMPVMQMQQLQNPQMRQTQIQMMQEQQMQMRMRMAQMQTPEVQAQMRIQMAQMARIQMAQMAQEVPSMTVHAAAARCRMKRMRSNEAVPEEAPQSEATLSYATPAMRAMLLRSQRAREASAAEQGQQHQPKVEDDAQAP